MHAVPSGETVREPTSDAALMSEVAAGDEQALARLYDRYAPLAYSIALRICGDAASAEEVVTDAFLRLWQSARRFRAGSEVGPWLSAIVRNRALDELRRAGRMVERTTDGEPEPDEPVDVPLRLDIAAALGALKARQRQVLQLAYFDGLTQREIAERTGMPIGTVKSLTWRALETLRRRMSA